MSDAKESGMIEMEKQILSYAPKHYWLFAEEVRANILNRLKKQAAKDEGFMTTLMLLKQFDDLNVETNVKDEWIPQPGEIPGFKPLQPESVDFDTEIELEEEVARVGLHVWSNVDKRFGFNVETTENDDYLDIVLVLNQSFTDSKFRVIYYREEGADLMAEFDVHPMENDWLVDRFQEKLAKDIQDEMGEIFAFSISLPFAL